MRFAKGHGTENDFVILPDPAGALDLTPALVRALCDRRAGIGADGVLRVVRTKATDDPAAAAHAERAEWFMDYRNADGGLAEMCGNGLRVFARYLVETGLAAAGTFTVATRSGPREVTLGGSGEVTVEMGPPRVEGEGRATLAGHDYAGLRVSVGNPHLACVSADPVGALDLSAPPAVDPAVFPDGVNLELYRSVGERRIEMRVYERGSGETRSCGTGAVAVAAAAAHAAADTAGTADRAATRDTEGSREAGAERTWEVAVPGGRVHVILDGATSYLRGPAVIVAEGEVRPDAL